jgi:beta-glucosidase
MGKEEIAWDEEKDQPVWKVLDETQSIKDAVELAANSDVAILVVGTNLEVANEAADRSSLDLPGNQLELIKKVYAVNSNMVVVLVNGMALTINWVDENIPVIVETWYAGQSQGEAIADVIFGDYNPAGRLPVTFYKSVEELPPLGDYDITKGRTYWFNKNDVLYPFGHGLSYTSFEYSNIFYPEQVKNGKEFKIAVDVTNIGKVAGDEVVQLYVTDDEASVLVPIRKLRGFKRIHLMPGESKKVEFMITPKDLAFINDDIKWMVEPGDFVFSVGGRQPIKWEDVSNHKQDIVLCKVKIEGLNYIIR